MLIQLVVIQWLFGWYQIEWLIIEPFVSRLNQDFRMTCSCQVEIFPLGILKNEIIPFILLTYQINLGTNKKCHNHSNWSMAVGISFDKSFLDLLE